MTINCHYCSAEQATQPNEIDAQSAFATANVSDASIRFCVLDYKDSKFSFICWPCIKKRGEKRHPLKH